MREAEQQGRREGALYANFVLVESVESLVIVLATSAKSLEEALERERGNKKPSSKRMVENNKPRRKKKGAIQGSKKQEQANARRRKEQIPCSKKESANQKLKTRRKD